ncbi:hypothetical protein [Nocardia jejuensis]|uniref:hypothetical protein n=1 Tax=Nocardia jejuensis TaxID=328049 RepID=UPI00082F6F98|nr:hypothetical protein [Nocardia jejuensis]
MTDPQWPPVPMWHRAVPGQFGKPPLVWLIGVHGGAGVTSLASTLRWAGDAGRRWPGRIGLVRDMDSPLVVLVARTHLSGLIALESALESHAHQATPAGTLVVGIITIADSARPLPTSAAERHQVIESMAAEIGAPVWKLPWIEQWRGLEPHELATWSPDSRPGPIEDVDATRTPPAPVRQVAGALFAAARDAGALLLTHLPDDAPRLDSEPVHPPSEPAPAARPAHSGGKHSGNHALHREAG